MQQKIQSLKQLLITNLDIFTTYAKIQSETTNKQQYFHTYLPQISEMFARACFLNLQIPTDQQQITLSFMDWLELEQTKFLDNPRIGRRGNLTAGNKVEEKGQAQIQAQGQGQGIGQIDKKYKVQVMNNGIPVRQQQPQQIQQQIDKQRQRILTNQQISNQNIHNFSQNMQNIQNYQAHNRIQRPSNNYQQATINRPSSSIPPQNNISQGQRRSAIQANNNVHSAMQQQRKIVTINPQQFPPIHNNNLSINIFQQQDGRQSSNNQKQQNQKQYQLNPKYDFLQRLSSCLTHPQKRFLTMPDMVNKVLSKK